MRKQKKQSPGGLPKARQDTSLVSPAAGRAQADDPSGSKPTWQPRRENTGDRPGRLSAFSGLVRTRRETLRFSFPSSLTRTEGAAPPHA